MTGTARNLKEWIGKTPDSVPPPHVRVRIFEKHNGKCHWSGRVIRPGDAWDVDHVIALINGGEESRKQHGADTAPGKEHKEKTARDVAEKSRVYRKKAFHLGVRSSGPKIASRGFVKVDGQRRASSPVNKWRGF